MAKLKSFLKSQGFSCIKLHLKETNHFELSAKINGIKGIFILDTGASNTCIGIDRAKYFNLNTKDSSVKAAGAGATEMETLISTKNSFHIGSWKQKKQKIVLFDLVHVNQALVMHNSTPVDGIIGADILKNGKAVIDYKKKRLYLRK